MLQTAENVAKRYDISRERQDEYGVRSQQRAAAAAAAGKFDDEIVPMTVTMGVADKETARLFTKEVDDRGRRRHSRRHDLRRRREDQAGAAGRRRSRPATRASSPTARRRAW